MKNPVKAKLKASKPSVGTWVSIGHPDSTMYLANVGFDWIVCDMEHGPYGVETFHHLVQSMMYAGTDCVPMARVPWNDLIWIKKALDAGAYGVVIPRVESAEEAKKAVNFSKYPPMGERGCGPRLAAFRDPEYVETANDETLVVVMIESKKGLANVDSIFSVEGVDACFIGPADLSLGMGLYRRRDDPKFTDAIDRILQSAKAHGVAPGMHCSTANINDAIARGFQFVALSSDVRLLRAGATAALGQVKGWTH